MKHVVWILVVVLLLLHHDFWFWNDGRLVYGIFPVGLFYHVIISIAAACVWFYAVTFAWPRELDEVDNEKSFHSQATIRDDGGTIDIEAQNTEITVRDESTVRADEDHS